MRSIKFLALSVLLMPFFASTATATVFEFRIVGDTTVLGTIEFAEPPSSASAGWTSTDPGDLISLFLDDTLFGLGTGNVLDLFTDFLTYDVESLDGSELDFASGIQDSTPGGPAGGVSAFIQLGFSSAPGQDVIESFANANFVVGDWTLQAAPPDPDPDPVPEPGTLALLGLGLLGMRFARRV